MILTLTVIMLIAFGLAAGPRLLKYLTITRFKIKHHLYQHERYFNAHFKAVNGFIISKEARLKHDDFAYVYGEIDFVSFIALVSLTTPNTHTVFYDLGSGTGKPTIATAMVFPVKKSCGIEILTPLHLAAVSRLENIKKDHHYQQSMQAVSFVNSDFMSLALNDATLIFINATAFLGETWHHLSAKLSALKQPLTVITTSKPLDSPGFTVIKTTVVTMSWGPVQAYIQQKSLS